MQLTRQAWAVVGGAVALAGWAVVLDRLLALSGTVLIGAWVLSRQVLFVRAITDLHADITVTQTPAAGAVRTGETALVSLEATLDRSSRLSCTVTGRPPLTATGMAPSVSLTPGQQEAAQTVSLEWPIAGQHSFDPAELTVTDGLFETTVPVGPTPTVTVEPRTPRNIAVGQGGDKVATAYGEHDGGRIGAGLEPAELRQYSSGDPANRIDWNATARLNDVYVREFDAETDRTTLVLFDHRAAVGTGRQGETKLAYLRELAVALVDNAAQLNDPLGVAGVGDGGQTERLPAATRPGQYEQAREWLLGVEPTADDRSGSEPRSGTGVPTSEANTTATTLAETRRAAATLAGGDSQFATTLAPFYDDRQAYTTRIKDDPLYTTAQTAVSRQRGSVFTVVCTDDTQRAELIETAKLTSRGQNQVLLLLAPTVLYETGELADLEDAYERYVEFEEFRRQLSRIDRVAAYEVAPGDRLAAVLAAGQNRRTQAAGGSS